MNLPSEIGNKIQNLISLCNKYEVTRMFLFGSSVTGNFNPDTSDVDIIVEIDNMPPERKGELLMQLWGELEKLFARKVDLLTTPNVRNPYLKNEIENTKLLIYDRAS